MESGLDAREREKIKNKIMKLAVFVVLILLVGTIAYSRLEKWSAVDSLYFSTVTIATIGYGDLHPVTTLGKIFTVIFILFGVAIIGYAFSVIGSYYIYYIENEEHNFKENIQKTIRNITNKDYREPIKDNWIVLKHDKNRKF